MNRIRSLRLARGLTQDELASAMGGIVTKQALSKYERGVARPTAPVATELARALDVRTLELFSAPRYRIQFIAYRSNAGLSTRAREELQGVLATQLSARLEVQERLGLESEYLLESTGISTIEGAEQVAEGIRRSWSLGADPIANVTDTLERRRVHVIDMAGRPAKFHGLSALAVNDSGRRCGAAVAYRAGASGERQRLTLAHELGHLVLNVAEGVDGEKAAFRFGGALLMPAESMFEALGRRRRHVRLDELRLLKRHFGVSMQALAVRAADLRIIDGSAKKEIFIAISQRGWRKDEPDALPEERATLWRQMVSRARAEGVLGADEARRWGLVEEGMGDMDGPFAEENARRWLSMPLERRSEQLHSQAESARELYSPGSDLIEWTEGFVEHEFGVGG